MDLEINPIINQALQVINVCVMLLELSTWASIQRHVLLEFDDFFLDKILCFCWVCSVFCIVASTLLISAFSAYRTKIFIIGYYFVNLFVLFSPLIGMFAESQCRSIEKKFVTAYHNNNLPIKARHFMTTPGCENETVCEKLISDYVKQNCTFFPKILSYLGFSLCGLVLVTIIVSVILWRFSKRRLYLKAD